MPGTPAKRTAAKGSKVKSIASRGKGKEAAKAQRKKAA